MARSPSGMTILPAFILTLVVTTAIAPSVAWAGPFPGCNATSLDDQNLSGCDLRSLDLSGRDLTSKSLRGADLQGANLSSANLRNADLQGADLTGADLTGANLTSTRLPRATLSGVRSGGLIGRPPLLGGLPPNWKVLGGYLLGPGADLRNADLSRLDLSSACLNANGLSANLTDARGAGIVKRTICRMPPGWTVISGWLLGPDADLRAANLRGVNLSKVDLSRADLTGADLNRTNLSRANLSSARLDPVRFTLLTGSAPLALPDGWTWVRGNYGGALLPPPVLTPGDGGFAAVTGIGAVWAYGDSQFQGTWVRNAFTVNGVYTGSIKPSQPGRWVWPGAMLALPDGRVMMYAGEFQAFGSGYLSARPVDRARLIFDPRQPAQVERVMLGNTTVRWGSGLIRVGERILVYGIDEQAALHAGDSQADGSVQDLGVVAPLCSPQTSVLQDDEGNWWIVCSLPLMPGVNNRVLVAYPLPEGPDRPTAGAPVQLGLLPHPGPSSIAYNALVHPQLGGLLTWAVNGTSIGKRYGLRYIENFWPAALKLGAPWPFAANDQP